jgi:hypothetical protein
VGGIRAWMAALAATFLLAPALAWGDPPASYSPGDRVGFEVPDSERGDGYTVSVDDQKVADGVDDTDEPGVTGEFTMPDLGSERRKVTVLIQVVRAADGSSRAYESKVDYEPAENVEATPASKPAPPRPRTPAPRPANSPRKPVLATPPTIPTPTPVVLVERSGPGGKVLRTPERVLRGLTPAAPLRHRGTTAAPRQSRRHARRTRHRASRFRAGPEPVPPKARSLSPPRDTRRNLSDDSFPGLGYTVAWKLFALVAGAGLLLPFLVAARARWRRRRALAAA